MKVAALIRVSTSKQDTESQRGAISAYAAQNGLTVEFYDEGSVSGAKGREKRPGLDRLLKDVHARKVSMIVATEMSRFSRGDMLESIEMIAKVLRRGVRLVFLAEEEEFRPDDLEDQKRIADAAYWAAKERKRISWRTKMKLDWLKAESLRTGVPSHVGKPGFRWEPAQDAQLLALVERGLDAVAISKGGELLVPRKQGTGTRGVFVYPLKVPSAQSVRDRLKVLLARPAS